MKKFDTERTSWLEVLNGWQRFEVVSWSIFSKKRYYIFECWWDEGKSSRFCYKDAKKMSLKEVRKTYKQLKENKK